MAALPDASVGIGAETTFGTAVTPTRWYEFLTESLKFTPVKKQGMGLRVGRRFPNSNRRVNAVTKDGQGDMEIELVSKGMGMLWQAALGTGTSTLVSGSTYQQLFTPLMGATMLPKLTVQKGVVQAGGTVDAYTFSGCTVDAVELTCPNGDIVKAKFTIDMANLSTAIGYTAPSYPASPVNLFHFAQGAITMGGSVTVPTTTALATGGTAVANVRDFSLKYDNIIKADRYNFGGGGVKAQPTLGAGSCSGQMTIEYDSTTIRDAYLNDTPLALTLTFQTTQALSAGFETFQVVLPEIKLNGDLPVANGTDLITMSVPFDVLDNGVAAYPIYLAHRTADTAL